ncbi:hypothetical protein V6Z11_A10G150800 [Gossypium hirsutum]
MKHQLSSSSSSMKSTTITMEDDVRTETRDSNYFPGCRKDANCKCEICLASINATLDLMPLSVQKSSFSGFLKPILTSDVARSIGERASIMQDLNGKLRFLQNELKGFHNLKVSNCSNTDSVWEIDQGSLLLNSHCLLYKSAMEEVKIWGWPLQTAGLLTTGFSSKSFTILSGRVSEWSNGRSGFIITRKANASWVQSKWGTSVIQMDPNTWIFEYQRSWILDNPRLISATLLELLKDRLTKMVKKMSEEFLLFFVFDNQCIEFSRNEDQLMIPT